MTDKSALATSPALPPHALLLEIVQGYFRCRAVTVAAEIELADHLAAEPLSVEELAARTKTHPPSLFRMMRALESIGIFKQVTRGVFANTPISNCLRRRVIGSLWATVRDGYSPGGGEFEAWTGLPGSVQTGEVAFDQIYGVNFWEYLKRDPARAEVFDEGQRTLSSAQTPTITAAYDWSRFPLIVDVGGGIGTQLVDILSQHLECRGILFDQPNVVARAILHERIERVAGSFFERVPTGGDLYVLRFVIHDWSDADAGEILKTVRTAMKPESCVILIEHVVPETAELDFSKWLDLHMMVVVGGQERTATEYRLLLEKTGLDLEQIVPTPAGPSLIIGRPRVV